jgi:hypothetical protein
MSSQVDIPTKLYISSVVKNVVLAIYPPRIKMSNHRLLSSTSACTTHDSMPNIITMYITIRQIQYVNVYSLLNVVNVNQIL